MKKFNRTQSDLLFILNTAIHLIILQTVLRGFLLWRNIDLVPTIPYSEIIESFVIGSKFDLIITTYILIPVIFLLLNPKGLKKKYAVMWLTFTAGVVTFFAILELDFYHEFHVRLNSLVFQYIREDATTVASMIWYGFPVIRYFLLFIILTYLFYVLLSKSSQYIDRNTENNSSYASRCIGFLIIAIIAVFSARGTVRHGPPLRWGDAFHSQYLFANHLALNGSFTLLKASISELKGIDNKNWLTKVPMKSAISATRKLLLSDKDSLINPESYPVYRTYHAGNGVLYSQPLNIVFILMESFSAAFVDSMGHHYGITPEFDKLRKKGVLFNHFFSNGTHTHQGMFASMACFPNLPGYETLMQMPQGNTKFAGILKIVNDRKYQSLYIYNGDFAWDNQHGFFGRQGMQSFIGRHDFIHPKFSDPTWGVSDEDMFKRAEEELAKIPDNKPFFAFLQTLSNHTPYALPKPLPVKPVTGFGELNEHLTAMRYSDWALGEFFRTIEKSDNYNKTAFIIVGDHGFSTQKQLTNIDLLRFHVPLLVIAPNLLQKHGSTKAIIGSQVDIVPTIAGLLGGDSAHSCWGRDLLNVDDNGFAIIKPSGSDRTTAYIEGDMILVKQPQLKAKLYHYTIGKRPTAILISDPSQQHKMQYKLDAYIQVAMDSLINGKAGHE
ncbi:MAG TPA: alkaline phosphatase family protein [Crenotrichaceae bacterium]|nr:alkaline phosphatase family protein [Crenotrichaceae bacterium]